MVVKGGFLPVPLFALTQVKIGEGINREDRMDGDNLLNRLNYFLTIDWEDSRLGSNKELLQSI